MQSEESAQQLITKATYDEMVKRYPAFMQTAWVRLWKQWFDGYVRVYQCKGSGLATRLNEIEKCDKVLPS